MTRHAQQADPVQLIPASQFSIEELTEAYNRTRVDYLVPMPMSPRGLTEYVHDYDVALDASAVASLNGEVVGLCMAGIRGRRGWITRLGVLPEARRHHIGQRLTEYCIDQARERLLTELVMEVIVGNTPAHALFLRLGFEETHKLLILRRPPGPPPDAPGSALFRNALQGEITLTWLDEAQTLERAAQRRDRPAWTNQTETLANAGQVKGLHIDDHAAGVGGWVSYETTPLQLKRVTIAPDDGDCDSPDAECRPPAYKLLHRLHARFPSLDTIAENVPASAAYVPAFYAHGYVESFARIEMRLRLG